MERKTHIGPQGLTINHTYDRPRFEGDFEFSAGSTVSGNLCLEFDRVIEPDIDGYYRSHHGEIDLNDDECGDLLLLLTAHLERRR